MAKKLAKTVFVVGAGFSADLGYPLTTQLLPRLVDRCGKTFLQRFQPVVQFHHPRWDGRPSTLPYIEHFLTELAANEDLLPAVRPDGPFTVEELRRLREDLLREIALWFHEIHDGAAPRRSKLLSRFRKRLQNSASPVVISFNWDYELDRAMFGRSSQSEAEIEAVDYGLNRGPVKFPILLKPHGSLNWYPRSIGRHIQERLRLRLWKGSRSAPSMYCFLRWRAPKSKQGRRYVPWIIPPTEWKKFDHPMMKHIWKRCVDALSTAEQVYFLGYSLPPADWHSRYIIRFGFHNQIEGLPLEGGGRMAATGRAKVYVVNPDNAAFNRIEAACNVKARWIDKTVFEWLTGS